MKKSVKSGLAVEVLLIAKTPSGEHHLQHTLHLSASPVVDDGLDLTVLGESRMMMVDGRFFRPDGMLTVYTAPEAFDEAAVAFLVEAGWVVTKSIPSSPPKRRAAKAKR